MDIRTIEATPVLCRRGRLTLAQIGAEAARAYPDLYAEARTRGLPVHGPAILAAHDVPQDPNSAFDVEFCLPVAAPERGSTFRAFAVPA